MYRVGNVSNCLWDIIEMTNKAPRFVLSLGKFRVVKLTESLGTHTMHVQLGGTTTAQIPLPPFADVREGDLLTLYTEVLSNAQPSKAPQQ